MIEYPRAPNSFPMGRLCPCFDAGWHAVAQSDFARNTDEFASTSMAACLVSSRCVENDFPFTITQQKWLRPCCMERLPSQHYSRGDGFASTSMTSCIRLLGATSVLPLPSRRWLRPCFNGRRSVVQSGFPITATREETASPLLRCPPALVAWSNLSKFHYTVARRWLRPFFDGCPVAESDFPFTITQVRKRPLRLYFDGCRFRVCEASCFSTLLNT